MSSDSSSSPTSAVEHARLRFRPSHAPSDHAEHPQPTRVSWRISGTAPSSSSPSASSPPCERPPAVRHGRASQARARRHSSFPPPPSTRMATASTAFVCAHRAPPERGRRRPLPLSSTAATTGATQRCSTVGYGRRRPRPGGALWVQTEAVEAVAVRVLGGGGKDAWRRARA